MNPDTFLFVINQTCGYSIVTTEVVLKISLHPVFDLSFKFSDIRIAMNKVKFPIHKFLDFIGDEQEVFCEFYNGFRMTSENYSNKMDVFLKSFSLFLNEPNSLEIVYNVLFCNIQNSTSLNRENPPKWKTPVLGTIKHRFEDERNNSYILNFGKPPLQYRSDLIGNISLLYDIVCKNKEKFSKHSDVYMKYISTKKIEYILQDISVANEFLADDTVYAMLSAHPDVFQYKERIFIKQQLDIANEMMNN